ncbi:MAG TPA: hypothetical protein VEO19_06850 [Terriglobia bacterium]|nr:hypothetical protein [Terriglobia bacterium]
MSADPISVPKQLGISGSPHRYWVMLRNIVLALASLGSVRLLGRFYGLVGLSTIWSSYVFFHPREGLWITPALVMAASLVCPPEGFQWGAGYSPELAYWAIAVCLPFAAMLLRYVWSKREKSERRTAMGGVSPPRAFYVFAAISVLAVVIGLFRGYPILNILKQFFGCALLCGYFLLGLRFAPNRGDIEEVMGRTIAAGVVCAAIYEGIYLYQVPELGLRKELTILSAYAGGLAVLLFARFIGKKTGTRSRLGLLLATILLGVPLLAQFKRAVAACFICAALALGLRSPSRRKRYFYVATAFLLFTAMITTDLLNPIGAWFSRYPDLQSLFPEDIQSSYSVFLRTTESTQVIESLGGVPLLGTGLGSTLSWYDPMTGVTWEQETLDVGWVYLLVKLGLVGTAAFVWLAWGLGTRAIGAFKDTLHVGLFLLFVFQLLQMIADPFFVYFMTAPWAGTTCAFLHILNCDKPGLASPQPEAS